MINLYTHPICLDHEMHPGHPERPARLAAVLDYLHASGLASELTRCEPAPVPPKLLARVHTQGHLDMLRSASPASGLVQLDPDTLMNPASHDAASMAAGAVVDATRDVIDGACKSAFCAVRPPGHHAERRSPMGFCFYNSIAAGAEFALDCDGIERVAILDFDVHHGNGTVDIFQDREAVLVCSSFQYPHYPYRLQDLDRPNLVHTPLAAGTSGLEFRRAIERDWLPALDAHQPQIVFVSAGFDAHAADPLGDLRLVEDDFRWITDLIVGAARASAGGRIVSALEGGYDLDALARSVGAHIEGLLAA